MAFPEYFEQLRITHFGRVINDQYNFGMTRLAAAHQFVGRVRGVATGVTNSRRVNTIGLPKQALGAPKTTEREHCLPQVVIERALQRIAINKMAVGNGHWCICHCLDTLESLIARAASRASDNTVCTLKPHFN